jgi:hypothetical protein
MRMLWRSALIGGEMKRKAKSGFVKLNVSGSGLPTTFKIQPYWAVAVLSVALFLTIVFTMKSTYSEQVCHNRQTGIRIIDESGGRRLSGTSVETLQESPFKNYVISISKHVSTKIDDMAQCTRDLKCSPEAELVFVYRPLVGSANAKIEAPCALESLQSSDSRHLDSPWMQLMSSRSPKIAVHAVFVWNERQFLLDQALMSGAPVSSTNRLVSFDERSFGKFVQDYTNSVLLAPSPEAQAAAKANISKRLPVEIFWLFRHAWQSTLAPFSMEVDHALKTTVERSTIGYITLTKLLFDQSFTSLKTELDYKNVLDLRDIFALDQYQINRLH